MHRPIGLTLSLTLALASLSVAALPSHAFAQLRGKYEGVAEREGADSGTGTLRLTVFSPSDTMSIGYLAVGAPLGGSGLLYSFPQGGDSIILVSMAANGDTIAWLSATRAASLGGTYSVRGGPDGGQLGRWTLASIPSPAADTFGLVVSATGFALALVGAMLWLARRTSDAWWRGHMPGLASAGEDVRRRELTGVGGWLILFLVGNAIVVLYMLATAREIPGNLSGESWLMGDILGMHSLLWIESAAHVFQVVGTATGLVLLVRRSPMTPVYWLAFLVLMAVYALVDIVSASAATERSSQMLGKTIGDAFAGGVNAAKKQNMQVLLRSAIWSWYFLKSQRVRLTFQPATLSPPSVT